MFFSEALKPHFHGRASGGLLLLISKDLDFKLITKSPGYIMGVLTIKQMTNILLIGSYIPPGNNTDCYLDSLLSNIELYIPLNNNIILCGNLN